MADIHILLGGGNRWQVVMHFVVPVADNAVEIDYRTALVNSGLGGSTSMVEGEGPGQITAAEKAQIEAGQVFEHRAQFLLESGGSSASQIRTALHDFYAAEKARALGKLQNQLKHFGHVETGGI